MSYGAVPSGSIRLFVAADLHDGATVVPAAAQAHYLGTVMRRGAGDPVLLFNGRDGEWLARIAALRRDRAELAVERCTRPQTDEAGPTLAFALLKRDATDLVVRAATELGAAVLRPVLTARTGAARVNLDRLAAIAAEAAEQSERLTVPVITPPVTLADLLAHWPPDRTLVAATEREAAPPPPPWPRDAPPPGLLVGPEGGFTGAELDAMRRCPFVVAATLGPRILRADTAVIAGLALLQAAPSV